MHGETMKFVKEYCCTNTSNRLITVQANNFCLCFNKTANSVSHDVAHRIYEWNPDS